MHWFRLVSRSRISREPPSVSASIRMTTLKTRFAPSPTGTLHIGGVRTALFSWLHARQHGGQFLLRIEDTDHLRSSESAVQDILETLDWLGLSHDASPWYQSQRATVYQESLQQLLDTGHAYYCHCSRESLETMREAARKRGAKPRYNGHCRELALGPEPGSAGPPVLRFRNPQHGAVYIQDQVQGRVCYDNQELDDLILARADGTPTYNLSVVVDDHHMGITDVIRGDDHLNNTPRQVNIYRALGWSPPDYAHVPMILDTEGKKLSKRTGAASALYYREQGYLPEAVLNYLLRLGWSCGDAEHFDQQAMLERFSLSAIQRSAARLNPEKLLWLNRHYMAAAEDRRLAVLLQRYFTHDALAFKERPPLETVVAVQKKRVGTLQEMYEQSICFFGDIETYDERAARRALVPAVLPALTTLRQNLESMDWNAVALMQGVADCAEDQGLKLGQLAQAVRVALTGTSVSPGIGETLLLSGRCRSLQCLDRAMRFIRGAEAVQTGIEEIDRLSRRDNREV